MNSPRNAPSRTPALLTTLQTRWQALAPREQTLVLAASTLVGLALLWWVALAPALATLRAAPARHAALDGQLQRMLSLQAEALQLQQAPANRPADPRRTLQNTLTQQLGTTATLQFMGDRANVTLKAASAESLAAWLNLARSNAHATPLEARLTRNGAAESTPVRWDGTLALTLPPSEAGQKP
jgi:general secretion pathway protein M